jgi:hypothetical protein
MTLSPTPLASEITPRKVGSLKLCLVPAEAKNARVRRSPATARRFSAGGFPNAPPSAATKSALTALIVAHLRVDIILIAPALGITPLCVFGESKLQ